MTTHRPIAILTHGAKVVDGNFLPSPETVTAWVGKPIEQARLLGWWKQHHRLSNQELGRRVRMSEGSVRNKLIYGSAYDALVDRMIELVSRIDGLVVPEADIQRDAAQHVNQLTCRQVRAIDEADKSHTPAAIRLLDRHGEEALFDIFWEHNVNGIQDDDDVA